MKSKILNVVLATGSLVLAFVIMEIVVRILDVTPKPLTPLPIPSYRLSENPIIGYEYRPGYKPSNKPYDLSHQGFAINNIGFRDYEYKETKPKGTYRIIVLGDSTTAGNGVQDIDKTYPKQLEKHLNRDNNTDLHYEVLNFGVGGYHTMQEIETLRIKGLKYSPDLVFVTFCVNDFDLNADGGVADSLLKTNYLSSWGKYTVPYKSFLKMSRLAFILHNRLNQWKTKDKQDQWYSTNILKGQSTVQAGFNLLSDIQKEHNFQALVVILPEFRAPFDKYRSSHIHEKVFQAAQELSGITVIDLLPKFASLDNNAKRFSYDDFFHLNEYGHTVMAQILLPIVQKKIGIKFEP